MQSLCMCNQWRYMIVRFWPGVCHSTLWIVQLSMLWCYCTCFDTCRVRTETYYTGHSNVHQLTLWQGVGTPRHCSIVSQRVDFYSAGVCSVWVQPPNGVVMSSRRQNMTWGHTPTSPCDSVGERGSFRRRWPLKRNGLFPRSDCHNSGCTDIWAHVMKEWLSVAHALVGAH